MTHVSRRTVLAAAGAAALAAGAGTTVGAQQRIVLRVSHALGKDTARHRAAVQFANRVQELTNGRVKVEIFSDGELGSEAKTLEGLQTGTIDVGIIAIFANVVPAAKVFELPFLFRDFNHWSAAVRGAPGQTVADSAKGTGVRLVGYQFGGWRDMYGNRPIRDMKDFASLKIRIQQTPAYVSLFKAVGAIPTPIAWTETYMALQQRTVDAAETLFSSMLDQKQYEVAKFGTISNHAVTTTALLVSEAKWSRYPQDLRDAVIDAEKVLSRTHDAEVIETDPKIIDTLKGHGMTINRLDVSEMRTIARKTVYPVVVVDDVQKSTLAAVEAL